MATRGKSEAVKGNAKEKRSEEGVGHGKEMGSHVSLRKCVDSDVTRGYGVV